MRDSKPLPSPIEHQQYHHPASIPSSPSPIACLTSTATRIRASQVHGINLHVDLNPSAVRRNVRSQQLEASLSSERDEIEEFIIASQEQEQNEIKKEVQNTFIAGVGED